MGRANEPPMPDPLAYYFTWPTYGTWLPGDSRGWIKRGGGLQPPCPIRQLEAEARMTERACRLDREQRQVVHETVVEHCRIRGWTLYAVNCRSNHIHVVVAADLRPESVRSQLKAWCTRRLKQLEQSRKSGNSEIREQWWAERGSRLYINDENGLEAVVRYVLDAQDGPHESLAGPSHLALVRWRRTVKRPSLALRVGMLETRRPTPLADAPHLV